MQKEIQTVILGTDEGGDPQPVLLEFDGIRTFSKDLRQTRIMYAGLKKNEGYRLLTEISDLIISTMLKKGVIAQNELSQI